MKRKAKIFNPEHIKTKILQGVLRDIPSSLHVYEDKYDPLLMLQYRLANELDKKFVSGSSSSVLLRGKAFKKFLDTNTHMKNFTGCFSPCVHPMVPQSKHSYRDNVLLRARRLMHYVLTPFSEDEWFQCCKHGTGTSLGVSFNDTSLEAKSKLPMTATRRVTSLLDRYLGFDSQLKSAVIAYNGDSPIGEWYEVVEGSRATTVPKTSSIDRMIAVEPTGNMFFQQGLMAMMYERMKKVGLDLESLPRMHKDRARIASITSKEATIDWSSASDCVSLELLRWLLPPIWFECCDMVRSPLMSVDNEYVELNMFSTMGNAVTFPLETLVFWVLAHAVRLQELGTLSHFPEWKDRHSCSVFGDDCIVPSEIASQFIEIATSVGFIINNEKSFCDETSHFRESCGGDYLRGYDVRPFHLRAPTSNRLSALEPWLYIIGNRLMLKYMTCFGKRNYIYKDGLFGTLSKLFAEYNLTLKIVPDDYPDDAGLKMSSDIQRLRSNYPWKFSRVAVNQHGTYTFLFCSFNYKQKVRRFDDLHYADWLRKRAYLQRGCDQELDDERQQLRYRLKRYCFKHNLRRTGYSRFAREPLLWYKRKDRGGYVVAKGKTAHWTVPKRR